MPYDILARVTEKHAVAEGTFRIVLNAPEISEEARPGQFAMVGFNSPLYDPFLRRPLAFAGAEWGRIEFIVRVVGWGTALIADLIPGQAIPVLGPLGNGFPVPEGRVILAAGGIGLPPLLFAAKLWKDMILIYGEKESSSMCSMVPDYYCELKTCTEDGSSGEKGTVTDLLAESLGQSAANVYCCGPEPMLKKAAEICRNRKVDCYVSLEARMACGLGVCQGCVVKTIDGYKRVCKDGPVFNADEIDWEALCG